VSIYAKRHLRKHRRLLPLQAGEFRGCRAAMTPEQEKRWYVSSPPSSDVPAVRARPLRGAPPGSLQFPGNAFERSKHVQAPTPWQRRTNVWRKATNLWDDAKRLETATANEGFDRCHLTRRYRDAVERSPMNFSMRAEARRSPPSSTS
jgi:hypothetical protein